MQRGSPRQARAARSRAVRLACQGSEREGERRAPAPAKAGSRGRVGVRGARTSWECMPAGPAYARTSQSVALNVPAGRRRAAEGAQAARGAGQDGRAARTRALARRGSPAAAAAAAGGGGGEGARAEHDVGRPHDVPRADALRAVPLLARGPRAREGAGALAGGLGRRAREDEGDAAQHLAGGRERGPRERRGRARAERAQGCGAEARQSIRGQGGGPARLLPGAEPERFLQVNRADVVGARAPRAARCGLDDLAGARRRRDQCR